MSRRSLLIAGTVVLVPGVLVPGVLVPSGTKDHLENLLTAHFGTGIADHPETSKFLAAYSAMQGARIPPGARAMRDLYFYYEADRIELTPALEDLVEEQLIYAFLTSTNVLAALDGKEPFDFSGLFDPYTVPCRNRLATTAEFKSRDRTGGFGGAGST